MTLLEPDAVRELWEADLRDESRPALVAAVDPVGEARLAALMRESSIPTVSAPAEKVWIWSDLHVSDRIALSAWRRPFRNIEEMDQHLLGEWRRRVCAGDTVICLGDVAHPMAWRQRRTVLELRDCPGERLLVLGNHDVNDTEVLRKAGFTEQCAAALCATEPPLALTHVPLRRVPPTAINVHGHLHGAPAPSPRHYNVSVERTEYAPVRLDRLLRRWWA